MGYESLISALLLLGVADPLRILQLEVRAEADERSRSRQGSQGRVTLLLSFAIIAGIALLRLLVRMSVAEMQLLTAVLMVGMIARHMFSDTMRNRELPAAKYLAECNPRIWESVPLLITLAFVGSWFGFLANGMGLLLAGGGIILMGNIKRKGNKLTGWTRYARPVTWLMQMGVLAFAVRCVVWAVRLLTAH